MSKERTDIEVADHIRSLVQQLNKEIETAYAREVFVGFEIVNKGLVNPVYLRVFVYTELS